MQARVRHFRAAIVVLFVFGGAGGASAQEIHSRLCLNGCPVGGAPTDDLMIREIYLLRPNDRTKMAEWVAYRVTTETIGPSPRRAGLGPIGEVDAVYVVTGPLCERPIVPLPEARRPDMVPSGYWKAVAVNDAGVVRVTAVVVEQETPGLPTTVSIGLSYLSWNAGPSTAFLTLTTVFEDLPLLSAADPRACATRSRGLQNTCTGVHRALS
jgi:hypothetical protein